RVADRLVDNVVIRPATKAEVNDVAAVPSREDHSLQDGVVRRAFIARREYSIGAERHTRRESSYAAGRRSVRPYESTNMRPVIAAVNESVGGLPRHRVAPANQV